MGALLAYVIIAIVLFLLQIFLTPKPKFENARPRGLGSFQVPTATEDRSVPIMWGTVDMKGPNVIWYGDLKVLAIRKRVKTGMFSRKRITVGFRYFIGMDLLLAYGPVDRIVQLEISDKDISIPIITPTPTGATLSITSPNLLGGKEKGGGIVGTFKIYDGSINQIQDPYLQGVLGLDIPAYVNISHAVWEQGEIGESDRIGNWIFRVTRFPDNLGLTLDRHIVKGTIEDGDANPAEVLFELLTDEVIGLNIPLAQIDFASFKAAGETLATEENGFSLIVDSITPALDIITEVVRQMNAFLFEGSDGVFRLKLVRDDFTPAGLPIFDESNIVEFGDFSRASWSETMNHTSVRYTDRTKDFIETAAGAQDTANVRTQGKEVRIDMAFPGVKHPETANEMASRELRYLSFPLAKICFKANRDAADLVPGDVIKFSWSKLGISELVMRVITIDAGEILDGRVQIDAVQDIFALGDTFFKDPNDTSWDEIDDTAAEAVLELVRQAPRISLNTTPEDVSDPELARILSVVRSPTLFHTDFEQFVDDGGGGGFEGDVGTSDGFTPTAILAATYPAATADVEVSDLLVVVSVRDFDLLVTEVPANIVQGLNIALIEGATEAEDEIIGWEEAFDEGGGTFTIKRVHRGLMDTQSRDHAPGARIWFFSDGSALSEVTYGDTQAISVKHQTKTTGDILDIADATANPLTFASRTLRPHHPANWEVDGTRVPLAVSETAPLSFTWDHRLNVDTGILDADVASVGAQNTDIVYDLEFRHASTQVVLRSVTLDSASPPPTGGTYLSFLYTDTDLQSDTGEVGNFPLEARIKARDTVSALDSLQEVVHEFNTDIGGGAIVSVDLDGSTEFLAQETSALSVGIADDWTINVWVRVAAFIGGMGVINFKGANSQIIFNIGFGGDAQITLTDSVNTVFKVFTWGAVPLATYTMLTLTWDGTTLTTYQDGVSVVPSKLTDLSGTMIDALRVARIGGEKIAGFDVSFFNGLIYSPAVWDVALLGTEVGAVFNSGSGSTFDLRQNSGGYVSRDDLKHLWDWRDSTAIGRDYGHITSNKFDVLLDEVGISAADLSATVP